MNKSSRLTVIFSVLSFAIDETIFNVFKSDLIYFCTKIQYMIRRILLICTRAIFTCNYGSQKIPPGKFCPHIAVQFPSSVHNKLTDQLNR